MILDPDQQDCNKVKVGLTRSSIDITIYIVLSWDVDPGGDDEPDPSRSLFLSVSSGVYGQFVLVILLYPVD